MDFNMVSLVCFLKSSLCLSASICCYKIDTIVWDFCWKSANGFAYWSLVTWGLGSKPALLFVYRTRVIPLANYAELKYFILANNE